MTELRQILYISNDKDKIRFEYISNEILRLVGIESQLEIKEGSETSLVISEKVKIPESKLLHLFDIISLGRELGFAKDIHGRIDQSKIEWDVLKPELNEFSRSISNTLGVKEKKDKKRFQVIFTHDVDWVSGWVLTSVLKSIKNVFTGNRAWLTPGQLLNKKVFIESYNEMLLVEKENNIKTWNFLLSGPTDGKRYASRYDINWGLARELVEVIIASGNEIGLHGSYYASDSNLYKEEAERLSAVTGKPVIAHRNHYLRINLEKFNSQLETAGIKYDFSVGYSSILGFRAGLATPYLSFNHEKSAPSKITEIPLIYMEREDHLNDEAGTLEKLSLVLQEVKKYNGCVSILFHPESFAVDKRWLIFYEKVIKCVIDSGADISNKLPTIKHN